MAIGGVHTEHNDDCEAGILIPGHMFALHLDSVPCGCKRRAEESPHMNLLDIAPYKHFQSEAIVNLDSSIDWLTDFSDTADVRDASALESPALDEFFSSCAAPGQHYTVASSTTSSRAQPAAKRVKVQSPAPSSSCSRSSSANTQVATGFLEMPASPQRAPLSQTPSLASTTPETMVKRAAAEAAAAAAAAQAQAQFEKDSRRGENVRKNPMMQSTARDGQRHWHEKVKDMRIQYDMAQTGMVHSHFAEQRFMCTVRNLKCQKESLLIFLQFAMQQRLIVPLPFVHPSDEAAGFLGWTGFQIFPGCGPCFRAGVEGLFPEPPKLNTLYHLFRRAGLVPEDWRRAWEGEVAFSWNPARVS